MQQLKNAAECISMNEIRDQIDGIDSEIIKLFAKRMEYVREITKFKGNTSTEIIAEERKKQVINQRSEWAEQLGLDKKVYAQLFELLIDHNTSIEFELIKKEQNKIFQDV